MTAVHGPALAWRWCSFIDFQNLHCCYLGKFSLKQQWNYKGWSVSSLKSLIWRHSLKSYLFAHEYSWSTSLWQDDWQSQTLSISHTNANVMDLACKDSQLKTTTVTMKSDYSYRTSTNSQHNKPRKYSVLSALLSPQKMVKALVGMPIRRDWLHYFLFPQNTFPSNGDPNTSVRATGGS